MTVGGSLPRLLQVHWLAPLIRRASGKQVSLVNLEPNKGLETVSDLFRAGGLKLLIDGPFPLSEAPQAVRRFGEARHLGKIVIKVGR